MTELRSMPKWRVSLMLAAIFLSTFTSMTDQVITPIINIIYEVYSGAPLAAVDFTITGAVLVSLPFILLAGWLCDHFNKKIVIVVSFAIFSVSTIFGAYVIDITYYCIMRSLTMIGWGMTNVSALAILAQVFTQEDEHGKIVGWYNAAMSVIGALLALLGGALAVNFAGDEFRGVYNAYWLTLPILAMLIAFVPSMKSAAADGASGDKAAIADKASDASSGAWWTPLIPLVLIILVVTLCQTEQLVMVSVYVADAGVGDAGFVGIAASIMVVASTVGSLLFGPVYSKMNRNIAVPAIIIVAVGFLAMGLFPSVASVIIGAILIGFGWSLFFCFFYSRCVELVSANNAGKATSIANFAYSIACAASAYFLTWLTQTFGINAVSCWWIFGVILVVAAIATAVFFAFTRGKGATAQSSQGEEAAQDN